MRPIYHIMRILLACVFIAIAAPAAAQVQSHQTTRPQTLYPSTNCANRSDMNPFMRQQQNCDGYGNPMHPLNQVPTQAPPVRSQGNRYPQKPPQATPQPR